MLIPPTFHRYKKKQILQITAQAGMICYTDGLRIQYNSFWCLWWLPIGINNHMHPTALCLSVPVFWMLYRKYCRHYLHICRSFLHFKCWSVRVCTFLLLLVIPWQFLPGHFSAYLLHSCSCTVDMSSSTYIPLIFPCSPSHMLLSNLYLLHAFPLLLM